MRAGALADGEALVVVGSEEAQGYVDEKNDVDGDVDVIHNAKLVAGCVLREGD